MIRCYQALALAAGILTASAAHADVVQTDGPAKLAIACAAESPTIALADTIAVTLTIEGSPALRVQAPLDLRADAKWTLIARTKAERMTLDAKHVRWQLVYRFAPREPGELVFQFPSVRYRDVDDADQSTAWKPITFHVTTGVTKADRSNLRGVPDIEALPDVEPAQPTWPVWIAVALVIGIAVASWLGWRRWSGRSKSRSPAHWAQHELQRLVARKLPEGGHGERFVTLLSRVVCRYLEKQHHLPARRLTTAEFMQYVDSCADLEANTKTLLGRLFAEWDMVKYAGIRVAPNTCGRWIAEVSQFLVKEAGQTGKNTASLPSKKISQSG